MATARAACCWIMKVRSCPQFVSVLSLQGPDLTTHACTLGSIASSVATLRDIDKDGIHSRFMMLAEQLAAAAVGEWLSNSSVFHYSTTAFRFAKGSRLRSAAWRWPLMRIARAQSSIMRKV